MKTLQAGNKDHLTDSPVWGYKYLPHVTIPYEAYSILDSLIFVDKHFISGKIRSIIWESGRY